MSPRRVVDLLAAGAALLVLAPVLVATAVAVRLSSPGPVLFRQARAGRGGRPFMLLKFRTMRDGAHGPGVTRAGDARLTRVGAWLRRWKIDELPQLLNVLRGEMSLIGPRPEIPEYLLRMEAAGRAYLAVQPGLADAATLVFYDEATLLAAASDPERYYLDHVLPDKVRLSVAYAAQRTLASDVRLIWALALRTAGLRREVSWGNRHVQIGS